MASQAKTKASQLYQSFFCCQNVGKYIFHSISGLIVIMAKHPTGNCCRQWKSRKALKTHTKQQFPNTSMKVLGLVNRFSVKFSI